MEISKGRKILFHSDGARVTCTGKEPLTIGEKSFIQICVAGDNEVYLSARYLSSGRILFDCVNIYSSDSKRKISVDRENMELKGLNLSTPKSAL